MAKKATRKPKAPKKKPVRKPRITQHDWFLLVQSIETSLKEIRDAIKALKGAE